MKKTLQANTILEALQQKGLTQKALAESIGVSSQAVTNWLKGKDFPRPPVLLKLASYLQLGFNDLVTCDSSKIPVIAFRKKGNARTTDLHIQKAQGIGMLLKPLVPYLRQQHVLRTKISNPSITYEQLQLAVSETRTNLGIGERAVLEYSHLISEFSKCGAVIVPVMWGTKNTHENAIHIRLPEEDITFIFLNLDTRLEDFKFWMAHELAHVFTPELTGQTQGEDYADEFAGALLFSKASAEAVYADLQGLTDEKKIVSMLYQHSQHHMISVNTVFLQTKKFAHSVGYAPIPVKDSSIHAIRNHRAGQMVSELLFEPTPPSPARYIADSTNIFQSDFFNALKKMILEKSTGDSYLQQILDISIHDAKGLYQELSR